MHAAHDGHGRRHAALRLAGVDRQSRLRHAERHVQAQPHGRRPLLQEWDNAPMPHSIFFDLHGHAIHGFFDSQHLGTPVSHGCVRLAPQNAAMLFDLVKPEGMANTRSSSAGRTPGGDKSRWRARTCRRTRRSIRRSRCRSRPAISAAGRISAAGAAIRQQQPSPYYGQPAYGQPLLRPVAIPAAAATVLRPAATLLTGSGYYVQPAYGQPVYRQW